MRQNQQNKQRMRGRPNNRKAPNPLTRSFDSNGPDIKIRGTALHIAEKYTQLARDASSAGDRVMAENYLQHAEHYYRIIAAAQAAQAAAAAGREDESEDDDFEPIGSDRFEPRQIEIRQPGQFDNNSRQPNEQREPREGGYQNRDNGGQQRDYNRGGDNNGQQRDYNRSGDNNRNGDNAGGDRQQQDRNEYRRDRRPRFDRFGRDNRGDRQGQNQDNRGGERQPQPAPVPTLADAPQPDVSFPDAPQPVARIERTERERPAERERPVERERQAPAAAETGLPAFLLERQPRVSEPAPAAVVERPAPAAERPTPAAERPAPVAEPVRQPSPEPAAAAPAEAGAEEEAPRKRVPRRRATTIGTPIAPTTRPRARRTKAADSGSEGDKS
jgi:hypothetical protein